MKLPLTSTDNNAQLSTLQRPYSTAQGNTVSTGSTVIATGGNIKSGQAAYDSGTGFWLGSDSGVPKFSIGDSSGDKMTWDGSTLSVTGNLTATTGTIGGWTIGATTITGGSVTLDSAGNIRAGQTAYNTGTGFWLGVDGATPKFSLGDPGGLRLTWDGTSLFINGFLYGTTAGIRSSTSDGSDTGLFLIAGGGEASSSRGSSLIVYGNEHGLHPGEVLIQTGDISGAALKLEAKAAFSQVTVEAGGGFVPATTDTVSLGTSSLQWSDLFLAEGGVINWDNGDATLTQAGNVVTLAGATLTADVNGTIGATTPAAGTFTDLTANGNTTLGSDSADSLTINAESVSQPNIPAFLARNSASDTNQTGAGATVTVDFDTEVFDQSGDFSADTFTAPASGRYHLGAQVRIDSVPAGSTNFIIAIVTSNRSYVSDQITAAGTFSRIVLSVSAIADMDAADTATVTVQISGGAGNTATIVGTASMQTYFSGMRVA